MSVALTVQDGLNAIVSTSKRKELAAPV